MAMAGRSTAARNATKRNRNTTLHPVPKKINRSRLWFALTLAMSAAFGLLSLSFAFSKKHVVQDDARQ